MIYKRKLTDYSSLGCYRKFIYHLLICLFVNQLINYAHLIKCMSQDEMNELRDEVKELFYHGYDSYMKYAFPGN